MTDNSAGPVVVVVGTDGSRTASEAVRRAADVVRSRGRSTPRRHRDRCAASRARANPRSPPSSAAIAESPGLVAEHILKQAATGPAQGIDVSTHPEVGGVVEVLTRVADAVTADLIVVGNQRPPLMPPFIAGSIADRLVHHASCDVLVVNTDSAAA